MEKVERQILDEIKKAKRVLLHLHLGPDGDSIGSVFGLWRWLEKIGKKVTVVSFDPIPEEFHFFEEVKRVKKGDVAKLDFSQFDLWLSLDCSDWSMISKKIDFRPPKDFRLINIDHHPTNADFGKINYVFRGDPSTAGILFDLFQNWGVKIDKKIANRLFLGIYHDTGSFSFDYTKPRTFRQAAKLLELGADLQMIRRNLNLNKSLKNLRYWSFVLANMRINKKYQFSIAAVPNEEFSKRKIGIEDRSGVASWFGNIVKDTNFGVILTEHEPGEVKGSLRSRTDFDVSQIAQAMGGGGHKAAAGFRMKGSIKDVERKLLAVIKNLS